MFIPPYKAADNIIMVCKVWFPFGLFVPFVARLGFFFHVLVFRAPMSVVAFCCFLLLFVAPRCSLWLFTALLLISTTFYIGPELVRIHLYVKSQDPLKMSFKLKLAGSSPFQTDSRKKSTLLILFVYNDFFVTVLSVDVSHGNTLIILTERNFVLVLWSL